MENLDNQTKELIPIYSLTQILSHSDEMNKLLNFESNRDHFSSTNDFYDYYVALDNYASELVKEEYCIENEMMISSFVENLLMKYKYKDQFYGSKLLIMCINNPKFLLNYNKSASLMAAIEIFSENQKKLEKHYLKKFKDKNFVLNSSLENILNYLISLNKNDKFVFNIFLNGNDQLKKYIVTCYESYFSIEKLSITQILKLRPYIDLIITTQTNKGYLSKLNLYQLSSHKLKLISSLILSNDENIVKALKSIDFAKPESISCLIDNFKNKDLLEFSSFGRNSSLKNLGLSELNDLIKQCSQERIISILNDFDTKYLNDYFSPDLFFVLLSNIETKYLQNKYLLENINDKNKFNLSSIYNILLKFSYDQLLSVIYDKRFLIRFSDFEMAFLLNLLKLDEDEIVNFINENYLKSYKSFDDISDKYILKLQNEVKDKNNINYINSLFYSLGGSSKKILDYVSLDDIIKAIYSNDNLDREMDISTMKAILSQFFNKMINYKAYVMFMPPTHFRNVTTHGSNLTGMNMIYINSKYVNKTPRDNESIFNTFFHEKTHHFQERKIKDADPDFRLLQIAKELIMYNKLVYGKKYIDSSENYCRLGIECDANLRSIIESISFFNSVNKDFANSKFEIEKSEFKELLDTRNEPERRDLDTNVIYDVNSMFDNYASKTDLIENIKKYPVLLYEYHSNGEKKSVLELFSEINNLYYQKQKLDEANIDYNKADIMRRIRTYRDLIKNRQIFISYNDKIISNKKERFNDWVVLLDALIMDAQNIQIVDYLINSVVSFLEVASEKDKEVTKDLFKILNKKLFLVLPEEINCFENLNSTNFLVSLKQYKNYLNSAEELISDANRSI